MWNSGSAGQKEFVRVIQKNIEQHELPFTTDHGVRAGRIHSALDNQVEGESEMK